MTKLNDYVKKEWDIIVQEARKELNGTCPLIEDETIVRVNDYIEKLENDLQELNDEIRIRGEV